MLDDSPHKNPGSIKMPFYGWTIVFVSFLIGFTEAGVFQNILSIFLKPMSMEFGWSRATITGAIAAGSLAGGIISPLIGPILDKHGPRQVAFWGVFILSAGLALMSFTTQPWQLYLFFGSGRMIAVGILSLVISVSVSNWFIRKRGQAMGIAHLGSRIGSAVFPPLTQFMILALGWRLAWASLGGIVFLLSAIPSILLLRRRPEDMGLKPDGETKSNKLPGAGTSSHEDIEKPEPEQIWTRKMALATPSFWLLLGMTSLIRFTGAGINFHLFPFWTDSGISAKEAVIALSVVAIASAFGGLLFGYLSDRVKPHKLMSFAVLSLAFIFPWVFYLKSGTWFFIFACSFGLLRGGMMPLLPLIWANFFGRSSMGSVYSLSSPFGWTANALGPVFAALCFDILGDYRLPFYLFAILFFLAGLIGLFLKTPKTSN